MLILLYFLLEYRFPYIHPTLVSVEDYSCYEWTWRYKLGCKHECLLVNQNKDILSVWISNINIFSAAKYVLLFCCLSTTSKGIRKFCDTIKHDIACHEHSIDIRFYAYSFIGTDEGLAKKMYVKRQRKELARKCIDLRSSKFF